MPEFLAYITATQEAINSQAKPNTTTDKESNEREENGAKEAEEMEVVEEETDRPNSYERGVRETRTKRHRMEEEPDLPTRRTYRPLDTNKMPAIIDGWQRAENLEDLMYRVAPSSTTPEHVLATQRKKLGLGKPNEEISERRPQIEYKERRDISSDDNSRNTRRDYDANSNRYSIQDRSPRYSHDNNRNPGRQDYSNAKGDGQYAGRNNWSQNNFSKNRYSDDNNSNKRYPRKVYDRSQSDRYPKQDYNQGQNSRSKNKDYESKSKEVDNVDVSSLTKYAALFYAGTRQSGSKE